MSFTLAIIKPDAVARGKAGRILAHLEEHGFRIRAVRMMRLTRTQAGEFYAVHRERPFYGSLVSFMTSGPCIPVLLEREDAVAALREAIGATDPAEAAEGTVRALYAESKERNAIHASDSDENAAREAAFFFAEADGWPAERERRKGETGAGSGSNGEGEGSRRKAGGGSGWVWRAGATGASLFAFPLSARGSG
jgi:nucleoside-diphosphate kinase